jgi:hypothetical protein
MFGFEMTTVIHAGWALAGAFVMNFIWFYLHKFLAYRQERRLRQDYSINLPVTMEEVESDKKLLQARHELALAQTETRIAEIKVMEAEALAKVDESLDRIALLQRQIEAFNLENAAKKARERVRASQSSSSD